MPASISIEEAQAKLKELIEQLAPGEEVLITDNQQPVAKLISVPRVAERRPRPGPGLFRGVIVYMAPDFDAPLDDLNDLQK